MPILNLSLSIRPDAAQAAAITATLSDLTAGILHKDRTLTAVALSHVEAGDWFVGGTTLAAQRKTSFFLDIRITAGTNSAAEKASYIEAVFEAMSGLLGDLHEVSYIHLHEAAADAWGYGGRSQQHRAQTRQTEKGSGSI